MTSLPESTIKRQIMRFLKSLPESDWEVSPPGSVAGKPDITGCMRDRKRKGRYIAFEVKKPRGRVTRLQKYKLDQLRYAGAIGGVVYSVTDVKTLLYMNNLWFPK